MNVCLDNQHEGSGLEYLTPRVAMRIKYASPVFDGPVEKCL